MKKLFLLLGICALLSVPRNIAAQAVQIGQQMNASTATAAAGFAIPTTYYHQISWTLVGPAPTACTITIDSAPDDSTWTTGGVIPAQTCTSSGVSPMVNSAAAWARINLSTFTGSGKIFISYVGYSSGPAGVVMSGAAAPTGTCTSGALYTITGTGVLYSCNNGAWATAGGGSGTTTNQVTNGIPVNTNGTATALNAVVCTPPAVAGQYTLGYFPTSASAIAPTCPQVGVTPDQAAGATVLYSDNANVIYNPAAALSLPTPTTLGNPNFYTTIINNGSASTITPVTWTISLNGGVAGSTAVAGSKQKCSLVIDQVASTQWDLDCGTIGTVSSVPAPVCTSTPAAGAYTPAGTSNAVECLSAGTYTLPTSVTTLSNNNTVIYCSTAAAVIERGSAASGIIFSGSHSGIIGCTLDDGAFTSTARFVSITGNYDFIKNTVHQDPGAAAGTTPTFDVSGSATNTVIAYNQFLGAQVDDCITINFAGTTSGTINNTVIDHNYIANYAAGICIYVQQASGAVVIGTQFTNNWMSISGLSNNGEGVKFLGPAAVDTNFTGTVVSGNYMVATARIVVGYQFFGPEGTFSGNEFNDGGQVVTDAFDFGDTYNSSITGNQVFLSAGDAAAFICADCARNTWTGNVVSGLGNAVYGIEIYSGSAVASVQNTITGNSIQMKSDTGTCIALNADVSGGSVSYNTVEGNTCVGTSHASEFGVQVLVSNSGAAVGNQILGNTIEALSGTSSIGINVGTGATNTVVGQNVFDTDTTNISDAGTTSQILTHTVVGSGPLVTGSPSTLAVTFSGYQLFATGKYQCTVNDQTTQTNPIKVTYSTNTVTFTGPNTNTDTVGYICAGY